MLTPAQITFLDSACKEVWTERNDVISVKGDVDIQHMNLIQLPVNFYTIKGNFICTFNNLTTLKGSPAIVEGYFDTGHNCLTNLNDISKNIKTYCACDNNSLTNLIGAPEICNSDFYCNDNKLTSLEGCPKLIKGNLRCHGNSNLNLLYGIGRIDGGVYYEHINDLNEWIIQQARKNIFVSYTDISEWIKQNNRLEFLLYAQQEIRQHFSPRIIHLADSGFYNESRILNYKKFKKLC